MTIELRKRCPKCSGEFSARDVRKPCPAHGSVQAVIKA